MKFDTFQNETQVINMGESLLRDKNNVDFSYHYHELLQEYKALTKISQRLVSMSDRSEEKLRDANEQLRVAKEAAESAKEETRQFLAMISHELRTPLAILQNEAELLIEGIRKPSSDNFASLQHEITHFTRLINDMFELSLCDINALSYEKNVIDLQAILIKCVGQFEPMFEDKRIDIQFKKNPEKMPCWGDFQRIQQVFSNILKNSSNYTDEGGHLQICSYKFKDKYYVEFADSTPGLTEQALDKIFQRFFRGESSRNRVTGGTGLGMSICQSIMTEHAGKINAKQSDLGGICIQLIFPINMKNTTDCLE